MLDARNFLTHDVMKISKGPSIRQFGILLVLPSCMATIFCCKASATTLC